VNTLTFLAGIASALFAWLFLVIPSRKIKIDLKTNPISYTGTLPRIGKIFNIGLVGYGLSQIIFFLGLASVFGVTILSISILLFGSVCIVLAGIITLKRSRLIHTGLALTAIGAFIFEMALPLNTSLKFFGLFLVFVVIVGMIYFYIAKRSMAYVAYWGIVTSTFWVMHFYFIL